MVARQQVVLDRPDLLDVDTDLRNFAKCEGSEPSAVAQAEVGATAAEKGLAEPIAVDCEFIGALVHNESEQPSHSPVSTNEPCLVLCGDEAVGPVALGDVGTTSSIGQHHSTMRVSSNDMA